MIYQKWSSVFVFHKSELLSANYWLAKKILIKGHTSSVESWSPIQCVHQQISKSVAKLNDERSGKTEALFKVPPFFKYPILLKAIHIKWYEKFQQLFVVANCLQPGPYWVWKVPKLLKNSTHPKWLKMVQNCHLCFCLLRLVCSFFTFKRVKKTINCLSKLNMSDCSDKYCQFFKPITCSVWYGSVRQKIDLNG